MSAPTAGERVEVMLCLLPWLEAVGGAPLAAVAERFGVDPELLRRDLETVFQHVEPRTGPDQMVEVDIDEDDDDFVTVRLPGYFSAPPELDHDEALKLLAAGTAMATHPGIGEPLRTALDKLTAILGEGAAEAVAVDLGRADPEVLAEVTRATEQGRVLELQYFTWGRDEVGSRSVDPWAVRSEGGHWYLSGRDHLTGSLRHFRVDRILRASPTGDPGAVEVPGTVDSPLEALSRGSSRVRLRMPAEESWVVTSPTESWQDSDDTVEVVLAVHGEAWLDRLLLSLGPDAEAVDLDGGGSLAPRRAEAARRVLARYGHGSGRG